jgi:stress-induced-phosphoprotein 1
MEAAQVAQDLDTEKKHTREIEEQMQKITMATYAQRAGETEEQTLQRAMRDPEVAVSIFTFPSLLDSVIACSCFKD